MVAFLCWLVLSSQNVNKGEQYGKKKSIQQAFPTVIQNSHNDMLKCNGMDMRDYFAGHALSGLIRGIDYEHPTDADTDVLALLAYCIADSMIDARNEVDSFLRKKMENSMRDKTGGPAFPVPENGSWLGMTLLDWFAGQALQSYVVALGRGELNKEKTASWCYDFAEIMIAEKHKRENQKENSDDGENTRNY